MIKTKGLRFEDDLMLKLKDPEFASAYIMSAVIDNDLAFLPIALGDVAKAHGLTKLAESTGLNRRTLYKAFDKRGNPSFGMVSQIMAGLGLELEVKPKKQRRQRRNAS
jgi:probable addiction module antidote protein